MKQFRSQTGYTLIELLLYVSMIGGILIAVTGFFSLSAESRIKSQSISEVDQQGRAVIDQMSQTVRNASGISSPAAGATGTSLTVTVPTASLSPTIFSLNGTTLQVKEGAAAAVALTNNKVQVTSFTVRNLTRAGTSGVIQISIAIERTNPSNRNEYDYSRTFTTSVSRRTP